MNRGINTILVVLLVLTMSCAKEPVGQIDNEHGVRVELRFESFDTKAATSDDAVNRVRIIIFGAKNSSDKGQRLCNVFAIPDINGNIAPVVITNGVRDIYLIVNEPLGGNRAPLDKYNKIATVADIEALELDYLGTASTPPYRPSDIPMFVKHLSRNIYVNSSNVTASTKMERMVAKVTLNLNVKSSNFPSAKYPIIKTITVKNLPVLSYIVTKPYAGRYTNSEVQTAAALPAPTQGYNYSYTNTLYVPEYILSNIDKGAYFEITGYVNGEATTKETKWRVPVGDAMDGAKQHGDRYDITRNRHYIFTGDVKSYGEMDGLAVKVTVSPWNTVDMGDNAGQDVVSINKTAVALYDNSIDKSLIIDRETGLDYAKIDITKLFSAIVYPYEMTEAEQGLKLGTERYNSKSIKITIENTAKVNYQGKEAATFSIQLGMYKHKISVTYLPLHNTLGYFGGVPKIPASGESGPMYPQRLAVALKDAPDAYQYKTDIGANALSIKNSIHYGRNMNISATVPSEVDNYPAFKYCASLNKDGNNDGKIDDSEKVWYLPSQNQLMAMYIFREGMDAPLNNGDGWGDYWSATEKGDDAWYVTCSRGNTYFYSKTNPYSIRCVRDL